MRTTYGASANELPPGDSHDPVRCVIAMTGSAGHPIGILDGLLCGSMTTIQSAMPVDAELIEVALSAPFFASESSSNHLQFR
jgi:hypothetical protein